MRYDIIIVGDGILGYTAALLAAQWGLKSALLPTNVPNSEAALPARFCPRSKQIFAQIGLNSGLLDKMQPLGSAQLQLSAQSGAVCSFQEPIFACAGGELLHALQQLAQQSKQISLLGSSQLLKLNQSAKKISLELQNPHNQHRHTVSAGYLLHCAGSQLPLIPKSELQTLRYKRQGCKLTLICQNPKNAESKANLQIFAPEALRADLGIQSAVCFPTKPNQTRWELLLKPNHQPLSADFLSQIAQSLPNGGYSLLSWHSQTLDVQIGKRWVFDKIILCGESSYQLPFELGLDFSAGLLDLYGLIWKLFCVQEADCESEILSNHRGERLQQLEQLIQSHQLIFEQLQPARKSWWGFLGGKNQLTLAPWYPPIQYGLLQPLQPQAGAYLPNLELSDSRGLPLNLEKAAGLGFCLLGWGCNPVDWAEVEFICMLAELKTQFIQINGKNQPLEPQGRFCTQLQDHSGQLGDFFQKQQARFILLRPDKLIFALAHSLQQLNEALANLQKRLNYQPLLLAEGLDLSEYEQNEPDKN